MSFRFKILISCLFAFLLGALFSYLYFNYKPVQVASTLEKQELPVNHPPLVNPGQQFKQDTSRQAKRSGLDETSFPQQKSVGPIEQVRKKIKVLERTEPAPEKLIPISPKAVVDAYSSSEDKEIYTAIVPYVALDGYEIMKRTFEIKRPNDETSTVTFKLFSEDRGKEENKIITKRYWKRFDDKEEIKTLFLVDDPGYLKGFALLITGILTIANDDEIAWFIPIASLRRTESKVSHNTDDSFLNTDYLVDDLREKRLEQGEHHFLRQDSCRSSEKEQCYVVETEFKNGPYIKQIHWINEKDFTTIKTEFYDQKGYLLKTQYIFWQTIDEYKVWLGSEMVNNQNFHKTKYEISELKINSSLSESRFDKNSYRRGKWQ